MSSARAAPTAQSLLPPRLVEALRDLLGAEGVSERPLHQRAYAHDSWPRAIIARRAGRLGPLPQAVCWPSGIDQIVELVRLARQHGTPLIPYGSGSGVCGGTIPVRGGIIVDLKRLDAVLELNEKANTVRAQCGIIGSHLQAWLEARGRTLGHFPSSIMCSTLGGYLATRSAGQYSTKYGKIEDLVLGLSAVLPDASVYRSGGAPHAALGPSLDQLLIGSEGTLGFICEAALRVHPAPELVLPRGFYFAGVAEGLEAVRHMLQEGLKPAGLRLYDELDTMLVGQHGQQPAPGNAPAPGPLDGLKRKAKAMLPSLLNEYRSLIFTKPGWVGRLSRHVSGPCLLVLVFEGGAALTRAEHDAALDICARAGGRDAGPGPGEHWLAHRYSVSYKQPGIYGDGLFVDTLETSATWDRVHELYQSVRERVAPLAFIMAHFSHAYSEGCSIYFSVVGKGNDSPGALVEYDRVIDATLEAIVAGGGALGHHHGIGLSKARFLPRALGPGHALLATIKNALDPQHLFNPGKLGLEPPAGGRREP